MNTIRLVEHDPGWSAGFEREATRIRYALGEALIALHHIGSTSIPGIVAKPVIDMLGIAPSLDALDDHAAQVVALGYEALGEFGIPGRRYFRKDDEHGTRTHQLHTFAIGSPEVLRHLMFRDFLRAHPADAQAYAALKRALARDAVDMRAYSDGKTDFIREIERRAMVWHQHIEGVAQGPTGS